MPDQDAWWVLVEEVRAIILPLLRRRRCPRSQLRQAPERLCVAAFFAGGDWAGSGFGRAACRAGHTHSRLKPLLQIRAAPAAMPLVAFRAGHTHSRLKPFLHSP